jgi:dTDP-4-dehydrorhamnose reductase
MTRNGHADRLSDLDRFALLGIQAIRYPVLWERIAPDGPDRADWRWADSRLHRLQELGIRPIVGLVHHGSGPPHTSLEDPNFPTLLAEYAQAVAERYPWVDAYTPVNEPLTTARFSGLYGHWYPHRRSDQSFFQMLIHECQATVLAMERIRQVNPSAILVQTEDLGKIHATDCLQYQAEYENERRWLSFDLLCGRVTEGHPLWAWFQKADIPASALEWFAEHPCLPDIVGINHYLTSNRFLDHRLDLYPPIYHGGNGRHAYADVESVRVNHGVPYTGHDLLLREAYDRYGIPVAITEAHLGGTREEQLRWLSECWQAAQRLRSEQVAVQAVTVWSILGAFDWNNLVTEIRGFYEPGAYDVRGASPRETALATLIQQLSRQESPTHPVLTVPGWWRREDRFLYPTPQSAEFNLQSESTTQAFATAQPILIIGARGTLGRAFGRVCTLRGLPHVLLSRQDLNLRELASIESALERWQPWAVINAAGYVRVDEAEQEPHLCWMDNVLGPLILARVCARHGLPLVTFSSDLVFNGAKREAYVEEDRVDPLNVYGFSKARAELNVLETMPEAMVVRTSAFFGPWDPYNFVTQTLKQLAQGKPVVAAQDQYISPTYVPDLVQTCLDLLIDGESGLWNVANAAEISWANLARLAACHAELDARLIQAVPAEVLKQPAARPGYSVLASERGQLMGGLEDAMCRYIAEYVQPQGEPADPMVAS